MKQLILFACLSLFTFGLNAQVFVDTDATGAGDGTSWADAYTNLNDALLAAAAGSEVWIADGTYTTPDTASFFIDKDLTVLGGFNGTETEASAADPATNVTILSGDVNGDDVQGSYDSLSRVDNQPVLLLSDTNAVQTLTININGLTIQDGNVEGYVDGSPLPFTGGGVLLLARANITNTIFRANHADFGSAIGSALSGENSVLDGITVADNYTGDGWVVYNNTIANITYRNSTFSGANEETVASGMIFAVNAGTIVIDGCAFSDIATTARGAAVSTQDVADIQITNTTVTDTEADLGGGLYLRNFDSFGLDAPGETLLDGVTLTGIKSSRWGGAVLLSQVNSTIRNVDISDVEAQIGGGLGGGLYLQSNADAGALPLTIDWENVNISDVETSSTGGGIFAFTDPDYQVRLVNVTVDNASAIGSGGGLYLNGGGPAPAPENVAILDNVTISNCVANARPDGSGGFGGGSIFFAQDVNISKSTFTDNSAAVEGGNGAGVYAQADNISVTVSDSEFSGNRALSGSGLAVFGAGQMTTVANSTFDGNGSTGESSHRGGAMAFFHGAGSSITIDNVEMINNSVVADEFVSGGAAIYISNITNDVGAFSVTNSNIEANVCSGTANGGGIYFVDAVDGNITNTDFVFNSANDGGALSSLLFEIPDTVQGVPMPFLPEFNVTVSNGLINNNSAGNQGGAVVTQRSMMNFTNVAFANNEVGGDGAGGGAIIFNGNSPNVDGNNDFESAALSVLTSEIVNCSFFGNRHSQSDVGVGNSIALFQVQNPFDMTEQSMTLTLQNNIFFQNADDEAPIELEPSTDDPATAFGTVNFVSNGGNLFNVANGPNVDLGMNGDIIDTDLIDAEEIFEDPFEDEAEFPLLRPVVSETNPLIGGGTLGGLLPATGIDGNPRGEEPEIGAYELEWSLTNVRDIEESGLDMSFFPNPTADVLNIESRDATIQSYNVILTDANGRILRSNRYNGTVNQIDFTTLPTGVYNLQLEVNGNVYSKQIVKQ